MDNFPHPPTLLLVGGAVIALVFILNRWLFGPLNAILQQRQAEIDKARAEFDEARAVQDTRLQQVEAKIGEARREAFAIREQAQTAARASRDRVLGQARADAAAKVEAAKAEIDGQIDSARQQLEADADELARQIAERVLGRPVTPGGGRA